MRTTYDKDLLHTGQGKAFKSPVEKWCITDGQQTLVVVINKSGRVNDPEVRLALGLCRVSGANRLLKLSASTTA